MPSFDVVSEVDFQEVRNAVDQAHREVSTRFDFKNTGSTVELSVVVFSDPTHGSGETPGKQPHTVGAGPDGVDASDVAARAAPPLALSTTALSSVVKRRRLSLDRLDTHSTVTRTGAFV